MACSAPNDRWWDSRCDQWLSHGPSLQEKRSLDADHRLRLDPFIHVWLIQISKSILDRFISDPDLFGIFDFASQVLHDDSYGSAIGIINFGGQLGGFVGPLLIGWIVQLTGSYSAAFLGLVISAVIAVITSFCIKRDQ